MSLGKYRRARELQLSMLPSEVPKLDGYEIAAYLCSATEVGGDHYDFFPQDDGSLFVAVGDASGHGLAPGILVSMTKSALYLVDAEDPRQILQQMNTLLNRIDTQGLVMAMNCIYIWENTISHSAAGLPPVLVYRKKQDSIEEIMMPGLPLGAMKSAKYDLQLFDMEPGDLMVILTDGLIESMNENEELYGYERTMQLFKNLAHLSSQQIIDEVKKINDEWCGNQEQHDYITMMVIKKRG